MNAEANQDVFRILMLISDTGGGHRASADALATMLREVEPRISIEIVDVWTNYGLWPFNTFVPAYKYLCDHPQLWKLLYKFTMKNDCRVFVNVSGYVLCSSNFRTLFETVNPHLVCSLHPLCQDVPIKTLKECQPGDKLCIKDLFNDPNTQDIIEGLTEPDTNINNQPITRHDEAFSEKHSSTTTLDKLFDVSQHCKSSNNTYPLQTDTPSDSDVHIQPSKSIAKFDLQANEILEQTINKNRTDNKIKHIHLQNTIGNRTDMLSKENSPNTTYSMDEQISPNTVESSNTINTTLQNFSSTRKDLFCNSENASEIFIKNNFSSKNGVRVPFVTVVTDLGGAHPFWFSPESDLCFVPSNQVHATASSLGLKENQIRQHGLPVRKAFSTKAGICKKTARKFLNLDEDIPICLLIAGGEGAGNLDVFAKKLIYYLQRILSATMRLHVVIICGKNESVKNVLEDYFAKNPICSSLATQNNGIEEMKKSCPTKNNQKQYETPTCYSSELPTHPFQLFQGIHNKAKDSSILRNRRNNIKKQPSHRTKVNCVQENIICMKRVSYSFPSFFLKKKREKNTLSFLLRDEIFSEDILDESDTPDDNLEKELFSSHTFPIDKTKALYTENATFDRNSKKKISFPNCHQKNDHLLHRLQTDMNSKDKNMSLHFSSNDIKRTSSLKQFSITKANIKDTLRKNTMSTLNFDKESQIDQYPNKYKQSNSKVPTYLEESLETIEKENHNRNRAKSIKYASSFLCMQDKDTLTPLSHSKSLSRRCKSENKLCHETCYFQENKNESCQNVTNQDLTEESESQSWIPSTLSNFNWSSLWGKSNLLFVKQKEDDIQCKRDQDKKSSVSVRVLSFVSDMASWMAAADMIVTKAGPGTIAEACIMGLPILLYCYLPGQEEGNVKFVTESGIGVYSTNPYILAAYIKELLADSKKRIQISEKAQTLMNPKASLHIAQDIVKILHLYAETQLKYSNERRLENV